MQLSRYKVVVAYDGTSYKGWQKQPHKNNVQVVIEEKLSLILKSKIKITSAGRTDSNVSALGQVFHFDSGLGLTPQAIWRALDGALPLDIRVQDIELVDFDFHARYSAVTKCYRYLINLNKFNLFERKYVYQFNRSIDLKLLAEVKELFLGTHDFTSFNATTLNENYNQVRTLTKIESYQDNSYLIIEITGDGFLRYMVRMLVETMLQVACGKLAIKEVEKMLEKPFKGACRYKAPPYGLYLVKINYE